MISSGDPRISVYMKIIDKSKFKLDPRLLDLKKKLSIKSASKPHTRFVKSHSLKTPIKIDLPGIPKQDKCIRCCKVRYGHTCDLFLCFTCNGLGHEKRFCPWRRESSSTYDGTYCLTCSSRGHTATSCLDRGYISKSSLSVLTCIICRKKGHLNCGLTRLS